jgi:hypothetical protein
LSDKLRTPANVGIIAALTKRALFTSEMTLLLLLSSYLYIMTFVP